MTIKNATRRYNPNNARDGDDCAVQPKRTAKERRRIRQETRELVDEVFQLLDQRAN